MVSVGHDYYRAHQAALVMLAAAESVPTWWQYSVSVAESVVEVSVERSDVDLAG